MEVLTNPIIKATATTAAAVTLLGLARHARIRRPDGHAVHGRRTEPNGDHAARTARTGHRSCEREGRTGARLGRNVEDGVRQGTRRRQGRHVRHDGRGRDGHRLPARDRHRRSDIEGADAIETANAKAGQNRDWDGTTKTAFDKALKAANAADADTADDTLETLAADLTDATGALTTVQRTDFDKAYDKTQAMCLETTKCTGEWLGRLATTADQARTSVMGVADDKAGDDAYAAATATITDFMSSPEYVTDQSLTDALASAKAFEARDLTYVSDMKGAKDAFDKALSATKASVHKDAATQKAAVADLNDAQSASYTTSDGDTVAVDVPGMPTTADALPDSITLPAQERSLAGMKWNVDVEKGGSVSDVSSSATVTADGTRVFLVSIRYFKQEKGAYKAAVRRVRVTVPFRAAAKVVGNEKAALKGFTVNGRAMDGYSEDVVDYTIHAGADEKVLVSPVAQAGQDVRAGDSKQTAYTTTQYWTVSKDGQTRTYSVTLVRDHDTPTADEAFEPSAPSGLVSKDANPSADNTALKSVGYTLDGVYHSADGSDVTVPEGGTFAYESYEGQTVDVTSSKTGGMTWTYSIGVLAADDTTYAVHDVSVTYLTAATHKAELSGIKADGVAISGFDPKTLEYTVRVANADRYVITPVFDRTSGMGVTVHKDGHTVTLTATSADGLVRTVYTVHVESDSVLAGLAATGVGAKALAALAGLLALLGVGAAVAGRRREM